MKYFPSRIAMTFVELVVSLTLTALILFIVVRFVSDGLDTLDQNRTQIGLSDSIITLQETLHDIYDAGYQTFDIPIDALPQVGNDVFIMKKLDESDGYIFGVVDKNIGNIEPLYNTYSERVFAYRRISSDEINAIALDNNQANLLTFFPDKMFDGAVVRDFQVTSYNSGTIMDLEFSVLDTDFDSYGSWEQIPDRNIFDFSLSL
ncbi:hypothetical protein MK079_00190 [Candidatus Gracilibacteria bacterium]|nr:hypothetical protein [Candidatus Gracilibacteria bacterium]